MLNEAKLRTETLQKRMTELGIRRAVFTDESSIAYLAGFWGYLGIEFGRPTMLVVPAEGDPVVITPLMESEMVAEMTWVEDVRVWEDFGDHTWGAALAGALGGKPSAIWIDIKEHAKLNFEHGDGKYNFLQKISYIVVIFIIASMGNDAV